MRQNSDAEAEKRNGEEIGCELLRTMDGDIEEARHLANYFFETGQEQIDQILGAIEDRNREGIMSPAHKCSGGASACGLSDLANELRELEAKAMELKWEELDSYGDKLKATWDETREGMELFFANRSS